MQPQREDKCVLGHRLVMVATLQNHLGIHISMTIYSVLNTTLPKRIVKEKIENNPKFHVWV